MYIINCSVYCTFLAIFFRESLIWCVISIPGCLDLGTHGSRQPPGAQILFIKLYQNWIYEKSIFLCGALISGLGQLPGAHSLFLVSELNLYRTYYNVVYLWYCSYMYGTLLYSSHFCTLCIILYILGHLNPVQSTFSKNFVHFLYILGKIGK